MMVEQQTPVKSQNIPEKTREKELDINQILKIVFRRKYVIGVIILISLIGALYNYYAQTPEYRAVAVMMIKGDLGQNDLISAVLGGSSADNMAVKKDVKLLKSMPIAELTVRALYKCNTKDSLEFLDKRHYQSRVETLLDGVFDGLELNPVTGFNEWVKSKPVISFNESIKLKILPPYNEWLQITPLTPIDELIRAKVKKHEDPDTIFRRYVQKLSKRINVEVDRETNVLDISVASPFPEESVFLTNTLCRVYKEADISRNSEKYSQASTFITDMLHKQQQ